MKKLKDLKAKTLTYGNYIVTIEYQKDIYDIYLHNENNGLKYFMVGLPVDSIIDEEYLVDIIDCNIKDWIDFYNEFNEKLEDME